MTLHLWYQHKSFCCRKEMAVAWDAQLKSNGGGGWGKGRSQNNFFRHFGPRFGLNIREAGAPLDPPLKASVHT